MKPHQSGRVADVAPAGFAGEVVSLAGEPIPGKPAQLEATLPVELLVFGVDQRVTVYAPPEVVMVVRGGFVPERVELESGAPPAGAVHIQEGPMLLVVVERMVTELLEVEGFATSALDLEVRVTM
jgi:hypothetical protein